MTLSRRDEFAKAALSGFTTVNGTGTRDESRSLACFVDDYITKLDELERATPEPERAEVEDDGREIVDELECDVRVAKSESYWCRVYIVADNPHLTTSDARLFALRILKLCDEIEGK